MAFLRNVTPLDTGPAIYGRGLYLRTPRARDYSAWALLREKSRGFLVPWEPVWPADDLTRAAYRRRLKRYYRDIRNDEAYAFFIFCSDDNQLAGGLTLSLLPGFTPLLGDVFTIIDNMGVNPVSGGFLEGMSISVDGFGFDIDYMGGDGNDVVLTLVSSAVPAPGVVLLLLAGLAVVFRAKRRSRIGGGEAVLSPL